MKGSALDTPYLDTDTNVSWRGVRTLSKHISYAMLMPEYICVCVRVYCMCVCVCGACSQDLFAENMTTKS